MLKRYGIRIKRADLNIQKYPDFKSISYFECKKKREPFRKAQQYVGLHPSKAIALDVAKLNKYKSLQHPVFIMIDVDFTPTYSTKGIYFITIQKLRKLYKKHPERIFHRKSKDSKNNACVIFNISIDECLTIEDLFG